LAVVARNPTPLGIGTMEWILISGCGILYFGGSLISKPPSSELIGKLFAKDTPAAAPAPKMAAG